MTQPEFTPIDATVYEARSIGLWFLLTKDNEVFWQAGFDFIQAEPSCPGHAYFTSFLSCWAPVSPLVFEAASDSLQELKKVKVFDDRGVVHSLRK